MHIRKRSLRFSCIFLALITFLLYFTFRLLMIQFFRSSHLAALAAKQQSHYIKLEPVRGTIFDRKLRPLAVNVTVYSLFANPRIMTPENIQRALDELPGIVNISKDSLSEQLGKDKYFVWLARKLPKDQMEKIRELKIRGLDFKKESKRYYPNGHLAAQILGFAGMDNKGLEGLELVHDKMLRGEPGWSHILRDARQRDLLIEKSFVPPKDGFSLVLTIDETIQYIVETALDKAFKAQNAKSATVVVMDPQTGEVLAMANRPTYDLGHASDSRPEDRINRAVALVYEPGSVFKIVVASAALEEEAFRETDKIFCENGTYKVGNRILHDHHPHGNLSFTEVIEQSSNIGVTKIAQKLTGPVFYKYAKRFRFGMNTGIDLLGEVNGVLKPTSQWSKTTISAMPMGHEVSVTPLQLACAISTIANGGIYMKPFVVKYIKDDKDVLIKSFEPQVVDRVLSDDTARRVKAILAGAVAEGTGQKAKIEGVAVAGKTGTAQKIVNGEYSHSKFYASFIGFAPVENPRIAVAVMFDEPHPYHYGGTVAAPVFKEIVENALKYLGSEAHRNP